MPFSFCNIRQLIGMTNKKSRDFLTILFFIASIICQSESGCGRVKLKLKIVVAIFLQLFFSLFLSCISQVFSCLNHDTNHFSEFSISLNHKNGLWGQEVGSSSWNPPGFVLLLWLGSFFLFMKHFAQLFVVCCLSLLTGCLPFYFSFSSRCHGRHWRKKGIWV